MATSRPPYCQVQDLTDRLFADEGSDQIVTPGTVQNRVLSNLIAAISRRFDKETGRPPGNFAPSYDIRLYSGDGFQEMETDEYAMLSKIEINLAPGVFPAVWSDVTAEVAAGQISFRPIRFWPHTSIFRLKTFLPDPYMSGNIRLTGVWGAVQPDLEATEPSAPWQDLAIQGGIDALRPTDPVTGNPTGWWIVPEDVTNAVIEWTIYAYKMAQAAYGDTGGQASGAPIAIPKKIPGSVADVITTYASGRIHLAMIGLDGTDFREELSRPGGGYDDPGGMMTRWAGWQTTNP